MPPSQYSEFNRCIDLMNLANRELALAIGFLARMVREAQLREAWLIDMTMWREQIDDIRHAMRPFIGILDSAAEKAAGRRSSLRRLKDLLHWRPLYADPDADSSDMATKVTEALRESTADQVVSCWVQLRSIEIVLDEWGAEFGGIDPIKPAFRRELNEAKHDLLTLQKHRRCLQINVVLRDPLQEEMDELTEWVKSLTA
jgi:hypothetical protein